MDKSREERVLSAVRRGFEALPDADTFDAEALWRVSGLDLDDMKPAEILLVLRALARKGKVHLIEVESHVAVARDRKAAGANSPRVAAKPWKRISNGGI